MFNSRIWWQYFCGFIFLMIICSTTVSRMVGVLRRDGVGGKRAELFAALSTQTGTGHQALIPDGPHDQ